MVRSEPARPAPHLRQAKPHAKRIVAIHRHYWPDTPPYATLLRDIVTHWTEAGFSVEVLTAQPSYKPELNQSREPRKRAVDGVLIRRLPLLRGRSKVRALINLVVFPLAVAARLLVSPRPDIVMCSTAPPVILAACASFAARIRRAKFIYHCMDLHPEIGALSGEFKNDVIYRILLWLDIRTCRRAATIVVLSDDMRQALVSRDPLIASRIVVINNFELSDDDKQEDDPPLQIPNPKRTRLLFAGNVGRFQGLDTVLAGLAGSPNDVELLIMGDGGERPSLERLARELDVADRVTFIPHLPISSARRVMQSADAGLVTLQPNVIRFAYPSKTMTYLAEGLSIVATVELNSELATLITREEIGVVCEPGDARSFSEAISTLSRSSRDRTERKRRARLVAETYFSKAGTLEKWDNLLLSVVACDRHQEGRYVK